MTLFAPKEARCRPSFERRAHHALVGGRTPLMRRFGARFGQVEAADGFFLCLDARKPAWSGFH
ncbi:hypothetical protein, partial [Enterovirga rhinocerotis]|uniref:hypothetical protein n=1 Tax=Enterovirga rhinocerotis TaxID=1339210 RepID=UPI001AACFBB7